MSKMPPSSSPTPILPKKFPPLLVFFLGILAGFFIILVAFSIRYFYIKSQTPREPKPVVEVPVTKPTSTAGTPDNTTKTPVSSASLPSELASAIVWQDPVKINKLGLLSRGATRANLGGEVDTYDYESATDYYQIGTFSYNNISGRAFFLTTPPDGIGVNIQSRVVEYDKKFYLLGKYSEGYQGKTYIEDSLNQALVSSGQVMVDRVFTIPALDFPATLVGPKPRQVINLARSFILEEVPGEAGTVTEKEVVFKDEKFGPVYSASNGALQVHGPHKTIAAYELKPDFFDKNYLVPQITWNNGEQNTAEYDYVSTGGCGATNYAAVVPSGEVNVATDLKVVGKNNKGDSIYELKDVQHPILKKFYQDKYWVLEGEKKASYESFVASHPLIFWVDPFNRLVQLQNRKFVPPAECGKPVIYLYPQKTTDVKVQVQPAGGMSYSDPAYGDGWNVKATPESSLTELKSGKVYPYLFWEGRGQIYHQPQKGFVVAKEKVSEFLDEKLAVLGLNAKETADFKEFWLPRMQEKPYYFVTFLGTRQMNELAPLTVSPQPDAVIRILMDFTPLNQPKQVEVLNLGPTPKRQGFTVIEWGGVIR